MPTLQELLTKKADLIEKARSCQTRMEGENKRAIEEWTDNEREEYQALVEGATEAHTEWEKANKATSAVNRLLALEQAQDSPVQERNRSEIIIPGSKNHYQWEASSFYGKKRLSNIRQYNRSGTPISTDKYAKSFANYLMGAAPRDLMASTGMSTDNEERGGYFQTSESFMTEIIKNVDDAIHIQRLARVIMMPPAKSLGVRVRRQRASTFTWAGENTDITPTQDTSLLYGKRLLTPNYLQGSTVISRDLIRNVPSAEGMVIEEIGIDCNYKLEPAFTTGDGNQKPLGLMTASADGISTGRDYTSGVTAGFGFDDWTNLKYSLKEKYRSSAVFLVHRLVLNETALLKDGMGQYLWQPSRQVGFPDVILGTPVVETEWMPSAKSSSQYFAILGDFSYYWIVYDMGMEMQRLIESRAHTNEFEYLFRMKIDAQPVLEEAFSRGVRK